MLPLHAIHDDDWEPFIGYIRVSTWREEKISPEIQRSVITAWAARTRRRILYWVEDLDESGRHFKRKVMGAIEAVERREARGIAVWRYSRFGRNSLGVRINLARLENAGGSLESATEPIDATTAVGEFQRDIHIALANFESNRAGEQWRETHALRIAAGVPAAGRPRFGYIWTPRRVPDATSPTGWRTQPEGYQFHPDYVQILEELYERKTTDHQGFQGLASWLHDDLGIPSPGGGPWWQETVARILDSGFGAGLLRIHDPECRCPYRTAPIGEKPRTCTEGRIIYVPGAHAAAISPDRWDAYLQHRAHTKATAPRARHATYPLTGIIHHGHCRTGLGANSATRAGQQIRGYYYICPLHQNSRQECPLGIHVQRATVEAAVRDWLATEVASDITGTADTGSDRPAPPVNTARIRTDIAAAEAALTRATASHARGIYDDDEFVRVRDRLRAERDSLTARLAEVAEVSELPTRHGLRPATTELLETWDALTPQEANGMLRTILWRVVVHEIRTHEPGNIGVSVELHPRWEPDPWDKRAGQ